MIIFEDGSPNIIKREVLSAVFWEKNTLIAVSWYKKDQQLHSYNNIDFWKQM